MRMSSHDQIEKQEQQERIEEAGESIRSCGMRSGNVTDAISDGIQFENKTEVMTTSKTRKEKKRLQKIAYERKKARAYRVHWRESDISASEYVPESDMNVNPIEGKSIPKWLVERGFELPFEVSYVYQGRQGCTHYWLSGPKKTAYDSGLLICIHGINGNRGVYEKTHEWLTSKGKHYVLSLDLFGHGLSDNLKHRVTKKTYGITFFTKQIFDLIKHLKMDHIKRTVVGFSMGGLIAAALAKEETDMVDRCIFISPAFFVHKPKVVNLVKACGSCIKCVNPCVPKCLLNKYDYETPTKCSNNELVNNHLKEAVNFHRRTALQLAVKGQVVDSFLGCVSQLPMWNAEEIIEPLGKHNIPTLILWGNRDPVADIRQAERVMSLLPNSHLVVFPKAEHVVISEKELETVCLILGFMTIPRHAKMQEWKHVLPISSDGRYVAIKDRRPSNMESTKAYHEELNYRPRYIVADERLRKREEQRYSFLMSEDNLRATGIFNEAGALKNIGDPSSTTDNKPYPNIDDETPYVPLQPADYVADNRLRSRDSNSSKRKTEDELKSSLDSYHDNDKDDNSMDGGSVIEMHMRSGGGIKTVS